jgi:hypothetical protein
MDRRDEETKAEKLFDRVKAWLEKETDFRIYLDTDRKNPLILMDVRRYEIPGWDYEWECSKRDFLLGLEDMISVFDTIRRIDYVWLDGRLRASGFMAICEQLSKATSLEELEICLDLVL